MQEEMIVEESAKMISADEDFSIAGKELKKVDLACGQNKKEGFIGIDGVKTDNVDIVHNLMEFPWPFEDNSIWEMYCSHFVEHIPIQLQDGSYGLNRFMEEVYRCLMPGGQITIIAPYYTSIRAWQDPTHCRAITDVTFDYYSKGKIGGVDHYMPKCNFEIIHRRHVLNKEFEPLGDEARLYAMRHYFNVVDDIQFMLRKIDL
jgi:SAM-dependent methyltransferase